MKYGVNELRKSFLDYFESKDHLVHESYSLIPPAGDKSLLLINAGMAPLKPYFTGQEEPPRRRMATCQKCIRTGDIDNVGKTARHLTFFEMLGNFSFGDYFKKEAIAYAWEYLTKVLELSPERLYPSIYGEDEEAFEIWNKDIGISEDKITRFYRDPVTGKCDNFWEHGAGPCGPCSEIYYDRGEKYGCGSEDCKVGCECDRYIEVWNNVFTQFDGDGKGNYEELSSKNIDTGMGLERLAVVMQDVDSVFDIDTMKAIRDKVSELSKKQYNKSEKFDVSIRLITDHIRSATFMICDGILPSNEGRGYVLRRLIRRGARHGKILGIEDSFMAELSGVVIRESSDGYPDLIKKESFIKEVLANEEEQFYKTIDQGLNILNEYESELKSANKKVLSGENAFMLYDTFGFPLDLTVEILEEKGLSVDMEGFERCMLNQKQKARNARKIYTYAGSEGESVFDELSLDIVSEFVGYSNTEFDSKILGMIKKSKDSESVCDGLLENERGIIITEKTPFYATMGGQQHDTGTITADTGSFIVEDVISVTGGRVCHIGYVDNGKISLGQIVNLSVDIDRRHAIEKNHSATHLLHKALKLVLGDHVNQAGSDVSADRLRFDFTHFSAMSRAEIDRVQDIVNKEIRKSLEVVTEIMDIEEAKKSGAEAHFDEKYGDKVRVLSMGEFSKELCGGTHVKNTGEILAFKIVSENGISSGVRRIEAITAEAVFKYFESLEEIINKASSIVKTSPGNITEKLSAMVEELKQINAENKALKAKSAKEALEDLDYVNINGFVLVEKHLQGVEAGELRNLGDELKSKNPNSIIVLASECEGRVNLMVTATDSAIGKGIHAGNIIKSISAMVGGGGGGRPNMAQAGGKDPSGIPEALEQAKQEIEAILT